MQSCICVASCMRMHPLHHLRPCLCSTRHRHLRCHLPHFRAYLPAYVSHSQGCVAKSQKQHKAALPAASTTGIQHVCVSPLDAMHTLSRCIVASAAVVVDCDKRRAACLPPVASAVFKSPRGMGSSCTGHSNSKQQGRSGMDSAKVKVIHSAAQNVCVHKFPTSTC